MAYFSATGTGGGSGKILRDTKLFMGVKTVSGSYTCQFRGKLSVYMITNTNLTGPSYAYSLTKNNESITVSRIINTDSTYGRTFVYHLNVDEGDTISASLTADGSGDTQTNIYFDMVGNNPSSKTFNIDDELFTANTSSMTGSYTCQENGWMSVYMFTYTAYNMPSYTASLTKNGDSITDNEVIRLENGSGITSGYGRTFVYRFEVKKGDILSASYTSAPNYVRNNIYFCLKY